MVTSFSTYSGGEFLAFYLALLALAALAGVWVPHFLRPEGREQAVSDPADLAMLASGPRRYAETVLASLLGEGVLENGSKNTLRISLPGAGETASERAISSKTGEFDMPEVVRTLRPHAWEIESHLVERGLLLEASNRWKLRLLSTIPYLCLLAVGWYRKQAGDALGEPTGILTMLMAVTALLALWRFLKFHPRTQAGQEALDEARERSRRLKSAPTGPELGLGVALFGTAILAGTPYSQLHAMRQSPLEAWGGSDSSGSGGDGGGCGGGCGGCGG